MSMLFAVVSIEQISKLSQTTFYEQSLGKGNNCSVNI